MNARKRISKNIDSTSYYTSLSDLVAISRIYPGPFDKFSALILSHYDLNYRPFFSLRLFSQSQI